MANEIHNYSIERLVFGDNDYYDIDWFDGTVYRTAKIKGSVIKAGILASLTTENIYNTDGTLTGDRIITGSNFEILFQTLGQFIVESHKNGVDGNVIFEVRSDPTNHSFIIRDHNTNVHVFACRNGKVEISDAYFLPSIDGTNGQVMTTDGAGNVTFQSLPPAPTDTNLYNSDGTITGTRTINGNNNFLNFINISNLRFETQGVPFGVSGFEIIAEPTGNLFTVRNATTNVVVLKISADSVYINNVYRLPLTDGTAGEVMTTDGAGNVTFQTPTIPAEFIPKISGFNLARYYLWANGSNTVYFSGLLSGGIGGTQTLIALGGATPTKVIRTRFVSGTSSGSIAGYRGNGTDFFIGMGFHAIFTFGHADASFNSSAHNWVGLGNAITFQIGSLTYASSLGNIIGVGNDPTDTTLQILHNDSTGSATKIPLGSNFPSNRTAGTAFTGMFCLELFNEIQSTQIKWRMTRIDTGTVEQGTITTNLPSGSTGLSPVVSRSNGSSTSLACTMDVAGIQIYTKY
jgi:hypothetical protein